MNPSPAPQGCEAVTRANGTTFPVFPQFSCLSFKSPAHQRAQFGHPTHSPFTTQIPWHTHTHTNTTQTPWHTHSPCSCPSQARSASAQRNSFSNFPWLWKQYTCLNNVDISNALKHSSNGAVIGSKWIWDYQDKYGAPSLYCSLQTLLWPQTVLK